jgi:hypothetical protein
MKAYSLIKIHLPSHMAILPVLGGEQVGSKSALGMRAYG